MYHFIENSKNKHLTIADVKKMLPEDQIDVVIWDRNFEEYWIWNNAENEKPYEPQIFFKSNHHKITYKGDMKWDIHFNFGETIEHPIHLDVSELNTYWIWCAIDGTDGKIHITNEIVKNGEKIPPHWKPKHIHWTEFSDNTRVGWRGPMMLWDELNNLSSVYYKKN